MVLVEPKMEGVFSYPAIFSTNDPLSYWTLNAQPDILAGARLVHMH